jgi:hypothetical protein
MRATMNRDRRSVAMRLPSETSHRETVVRLSTSLSLGLVMLLYGPLAAAQSTLGQLLDAGARKLSAAEFQAELVQRVIVGPTAQGGSLEIIYTTRGIVSGTAEPKLKLNKDQTSPITGTWTIGEQEAICAQMRLVGPRGVNVSVTLPNRCEFWFKLGGQYFLADTDWDRSSAVLNRALKQ